MGSIVIAGGKVTLALGSAERLGKEGGKTLATSQRSALISGRPPSQLCPFSSDLIHTVGGLAFMQRFLVAHHVAPASGQKSIFCEFLRSVEHYNQQNDRSLMIKVLQLIRPGFAG
jgi:hypothetical protein